MFKTVSITKVMEMLQFIIDRCPKEGQIVNLNPNQITRRFERVFPKLEIKNFQFYDLR